MVGIIWLVCGEVCDLVFFVECVFVLFIVWVSVKLYLSNLGEKKFKWKILWNYYSLLVFVILYLKMMFLIKEMLLKKN